MTEKYVIDAYAWVEYLIGSKNGEKVKHIVENENNDIYTSAVTLAEVVSKTAREKRDIEIAYDILTSNSQIINADETISKEAGILHSQTRTTQKDFGLADAYVLAVAKKTKSKILTGDIHFKNIKEAILIQEQTHNTTTNTTR